MGENLLAVDDLSKHFHLPDKKVVQALDKVFLKIRKGEIVGVIGESGSGKTTLARIIVGLEEADQGKIEWYNSSKTQPFLVQMIFQNPYGSLYRGMRIREILQEPLLIQGLVKNKKQVDEKIKSILQQVNLPPEEGYQDRYPYQLSGGQRQRVALARALMLDPDLLIADEPTSMLDMSVQADILQLLLDLRREKGLGILLITHDMAVASYLCDRIMVLKEGVVVENGVTEEVIENPNHSYTRQLVEIAKKNSRILEI